MQSKPVPENVQSNRTNEISRTSGKLHNAPKKRTHRRTRIGDGIYEAKALEATQPSDQRNADTAKHRSNEVKGRRKSRSNQVTGKVLGEPPIMEAGQLADTDARLPAQNDGGWTVVVPRSSRRPGKAEDLGVRGATHAPLTIKK